MLILEQKHCGSLFVIQKNLEGIRKMITARFLKNGAYVLIAICICVCAYQISHWKIYPWIQLLTCLFVPLFSLFPFQAVEISVTGDALDKAGGVNLIL